MYSRVTGDGHRRIGHSGVGVSAIGYRLQDPAVESRNDFPTAYRHHLSWVGPTTLGRPCGRRMVAEGRGRTTSCPIERNGRGVASPLPWRSPSGERMGRRRAPTHRIPGQLFNESTHAASFRFRGIGDPLSGSGVQVRSGQLSRVPKIRK